MSAPSLEPSKLLQYMQTDRHTIKTTAQRVGAGKVSVDALIAEGLTSASSLVRIAECIVQLDSEVQALRRDVDELRT